MADREIGDLETVLGRLNDANDTELELVDTEHRVKSKASLTRKYAFANLEEPLTAAEFLSAVDDLVRFTMLIPEASYGPTVAAVLSSLAEQGHTVADGTDIKNFWKAGNRSLGLTVTLSTPSGRLMELQCPTRLSYEVGKRTRPDYHLLRGHNAPVDMRVMAFASIMQAGAEAGIDLTIPDTSGLPTPLDTSPDRYFRENSEQACHYRAQLALEGLSVIEHLTAAGFSTGVASRLAAVIEKAIEGEPWDGLGEPIYHEVTSRRRPGPANLFIVEPSVGPIRAVRLDHLTKTWTFDPLIVQYSLMEDFDKGEDRISRVNRSRAEEIAQLFETPLPSEDQLRRLMQEGANTTTD